MMLRYYRLVRGHKRPWRFVVARLLMAARISHWITIQQRGFRLRFHRANLASQLWIDPDEREQALRFFRDYLKAGDVVVDVGANIGDTALASAVQVGVTGRVVALEPHPRVFQYLRENVALNHLGQVELLNVAAGATPSTGRLSDDRRDDMNRIDAGAIPVPVIRLDDVTHALGTVALLKIDVEGYEKFVLEGARALLGRTECVYIEVAESHFAEFGYAVRDVLRLLQDAGLRLLHVPELGSVVGISADFQVSNVINVIAVRDVDRFVARTGWRFREAL